MWDNIITFYISFFSFFPDVVFSISYELCDPCLPAESGGCPGSYGYAGPCCDGRDLQSTVIKRVCPNSSFNWERTFPDPYIVGPTFLSGSDWGCFPASDMYYQTWNYTYCYWDGNLYESYEVPYCIDIGGSWMTCELTNVVIEYRYDPIDLPCSCCQDNDNDNDGFTGCDGDCNNNDPTVYPGAPEVCDVKDNNCNNQVDEGCCYNDDNDGYSTCTGDCIVMIMMQQSILALKKYVME